MTGEERTTSSRGTTDDESGVGEATNVWVMGALLLVAAALPVSGVLNNVTLQVAFYVLLYATLALGLNVVVGFAGLLNLGYIAFFGIGAYTYGLLASDKFGIHLPIVVAIPLAAVLAAAFGLLFALPTLRLRGDYLAIVTLGFGLIVQLTVNNATPITNGPAGLFNLDPASLFGANATSIEQYYYLMLGALALVVLLTLRLGRSHVGRAWAAIREDEAAARASGVNTVRMKLWAFSISAAVGGAVGPVFAASQGYIGPVQISLDASVLVLTMVILGGTGSVRGVILGALLLVVLPEFLREYAAARFVLVGAIMALLMVVRPQGLIPPSARPWRWLASKVNSVGRGMIGG